MSLNIRGVLNRVEAGAQAGAHQAAAALHAQAIPLTPFRDGDLRNSSSVDSQGVGEGAQAVVKFTQEYAGIQHEKYPRKNHPGTQTKFLETPARNPQVQAHMKQIIAQHIRRSL